MFKKFLCIIALLVNVLVANARDYSEIVSSYDKVFLYFTSPRCGTCVKFDPYYRKLYETYNKDCKFIKIDAATQDGLDYFRKVNVFGVPTVILLDNKKKTANKVALECMFNMACIRDAIDKFVH